MGKNEKQASRRERVAMGGDPVLFEVDLIGFLPKSIDADHFERFQVGLTAELADRGYTDVVLGSATTMECLEVRVTTPPLTSVDEARRAAVKDVGGALEHLGCRLTGGVQWESVRQMVGTAPPATSD